MPHNHRFSRNRKVFRSQHDKVVGGVLGGFADFFDISSFWLRLGFAVFAFLQPHIAIPAYFICFFIMPRHGHRRCRPQHDGSPHQEQDRDFHRESPGMQERLNKGIDYTMEQLERKVRQLEDLVTDKEFMLRQKFKNL